MTDVPQPPAGWELVDGKIRRELSFANFAEAWAFMTRVALLAEKRYHHPDWSNSWNQVTIELVSHDVGAVTARDIGFAASINQLLDHP